MSILNVNKINPVGGGSTVTIAGIASVTNNLTATNISAGSSVTATTFYGDGSNLTSLPAQATVNNNADNRVITGGSGVNLYAESGFTYDGTIVQIPDRINLNTAGTYIKSNQIAFNPTGTAYLDHYRTGQDIQIRMSTSSSLDTTGPTFKSNGNLAFASGKGIDFSATGDASGKTSEILNDYEVGTFTPTFDTSAASGAIGSITYSMQSGHYTKVGDLVYVEGVLRANVTNNSTGTWDIGGLPFTYSNNNGTAAIIHAKDQASWVRAPHHFSMLGNTTRARARGGIDVGDNGYTNGQSDMFLAGSSNYNRVYFAGCYKAA